MGHTDQQTNIHLPDLQFSKLCENKHGINKGLYNTIDSWFFHQGITDIRKRRIMILDFLQKGGCHAGAKFGNGGLRAKLDQYWERSRALV